MLEIELSGGRKMLIMKDDNGISEELTLKGCHEPYATQMVVALSKMVYAIEPVPRNVSCLIANIQKYGHKNIRVFQTAIGAENKKANMRLAQFSNSGTLIEPERSSPHYENWFCDWYTEDIEVNVMTLDSLREKFDIPVPDMIRMDVEGYEIDVFAGADETLKAMPTKSIIFIEIHPVVFDDRIGTIGALIDRIYGYGFRPLWIEGLNEFPKRKDKFIEFACSTELHCPHIFFEKKVNKK
jgi:FkbM family methyltransferase